MQELKMNELEHVSGGAVTVGLILTAAGIAVAIGLTGFNHGRDDALN